MLKKSLFLGLALLMIGLTVVQSQDFAQMEKDLKQVEADLKAGKITPAQAQQKIAEIQQKYLGMSDAAIGGPTGKASTSGTAEGQAQNQRIVDQANRAGQQASQTPQPQQQETFPAGETSGWPSAAIFRQWNIPALRQPAGLTVSYTNGNYGLQIFIKNGTQATIDQLGREIDAAKLQYPSSKSPGQYSRALPKPSGVNEDFYGILINLEDGGVMVNTQRTGGN
ncbi:MAG: hypothetical protein LBI04_02955 [Treponema sp.]|jgi:hypothetical protein|nr:hypothetical protein [Treponema sp.]